MRTIKTEKQFRITQGKKFRTENGFDFAKLGQLVRLDDLRVGRIRYIGRLHFTRGDFVGLELLNCTGKSNGSVKNRKYFEAAENSAIFVVQKKVFEVVDESEKSVIAESKDHFEYMREIYASCNANDLIRYYPRRLKATIMDELADKFGLGAVHLIHEVFHFLGDYEKSYSLSLEIKFDLQDDYRTGSNLTLHLYNDKRGARKGNAIWMYEYEDSDYWFYKMSQNKKIPVCRREYSFDWKIANGEYAFSWCGYSYEIQRWMRWLMKTCKYVKMRSHGIKSSNMRTVVTMNFGVHNGKWTDYSKPLINDTR